MTGGDREVSLEEAAAVRRTDDDPEGVIGIEASDTVTADDYDRILDSAPDEAIRAPRPMPATLRVFSISWHHATATSVAGS